jgi:hypothetical protein
LAGCALFGQGIAQEEGWLLKIPEDHKENAADEIENTKEEYSATPVSDPPES